MDAVDRLGAVVDELNAIEVDLILREYADKDGAQELSELLDRARRVWMHFKHAKQVYGWTGEKLYGPT